MEKVRDTTLGFYAAKTSDPKNVWPCLSAALESLLLPLTFVFSLVPAFPSPSPTPAV